MTHLYLLGGMEALNAFTPHWLEVCGPRVAILSHAYSEKYAAFYRDLWPGVETHFIAPGGPETGAAAALALASALFVAGGPTERYWDLYAQEPLRSLIRERYRAGMPYAGLSAGALLAPERCFLPEQDTGRPAEFRPGLGLLGRTLPAVHCTAWGGPAAFQAALAQWPGAQALGLDDHVTAYFENETLTAELGGKATHF